MLCWNAPSWITILLDVSVPWPSCLIAAAISPRCCRPFMLRRLKKEVEKSLPPKEETILFTGEG